MKNKGHFSMSWLILFLLGPGLFYLGIKLKSGSVIAVGCGFTLVFIAAIWSRFRRRRPPTFEEFFRRCCRHVKLEDKEDLRLFRMLAECRMHDPEYITWQSRRVKWSPRWPATEDQLALISALDYTGRRPRSVIEASDLIDELKVVSEYHKEKAARQLRRVKLERAKEERLAKEAAEEESRRRKAESKRQDLLARMRATPPRPSITKKARMKWLLEFQQLWNDATADGETVMRPDVEMLHAWLIAHRTADVQHDDFIAALQKLLSLPGDRHAIDPGMFDLASACAENLGGKVVAC